MASARNIVRRLTEGVDDPENLDSPEGFALAGHLDSPVATLAAKNGFTRLDRYEGEERWVKKLSNGHEAWLRTRARNEYDRPETLDMQDPQRHGGRHWEFLEVYPVRVCAYCNNPVPKKTAKCPHCRKSAGVREYNDHRQLAAGNEVTMSYLLGAILQRLATWPEHLPKPGQPGWKKAFENLGVQDPDDPDAFIQREVELRTPYYAVMRLKGQNTVLYHTGNGWMSDQRYAKKYTALDANRVHDLNDEHLLFMDAWDVICLRGVDELMARYESFGHPWVVNAEINCWPNAGLTSRYPACDTPYRHLNSGCMLVERQYAKKWASTVPTATIYAPYGESYAFDDQYWWALRYLENPGLMMLDTRCELFQCLYQSRQVMQFSLWHATNTVTGTQPLIIHFNSNGDINQLRGELWNLDSPPPTPGGTSPPPPAPHPC